MTDPFNFPAVFGDIPPEYEMCVSDLNIQRSGMSNGNYEVELSLVYRQKNSIFPHSSLYSFQIKTHLDTLPATNDDAWIEWGLNFLKEQSHAVLSERQTSREKS